MRKKVSSFRSYDHKKDKGKKFTGKSMTEPDQSTNLKTILDRHGVDMEDRTSQEYITQDSKLRSLLKNVNVRVDHMSKMDRVERETALKDMSRDVQELSDAYNEQVRIVTDEAKKVHEARVEAAARLKLESEPFDETKKPE